MSSGLNTEERRRFRKDTPLGATSLIRELAPLAPLNWTALTRARVPSWVERGQFAIGKDGLVSAHRGPLSPDDPC